MTVRDRHWDNLAGFYPYVIFNQLPGRIRLGSSLHIGDGLNQSHDQDQLTGECASYRHAAADTKLWSCAGSGTP